MAFEQIASEVGYRDATALRRVLRRAAHATLERFRATTMVAR